MNSFNIFLCSASALLTFLEDFIVCLILHSKLLMWYCFSTIYCLCCHKPVISWVLAKCTQICIILAWRWQCWNLKCVLYLSAPLFLHDNVTIYLYRNWNLKQSFWSLMFKFLQILISIFFVHSDIIYIPKMCLNIFQHISYSVTENKKVYEQLSLFSHRNLKKFKIIKRFERF